MRGLRRPKGPRAYLRSICGGAPVFPIVVLFGLNAVDELDRTAFGVLIPNIRDAFGMTTTGILTLVALVTFAGLLVEVPLAYYADRYPRARIAALGAAVWGVFSVFTGLATTIWMLAVARSGAGIGRAVVTPTHNSLIADYYPIEVRPKVYGFHRAANAVGQFLGPALGGLLALWLGWRWPFLLFAIPTVVFVVLALRLREPNRGHFERAAAGADADVVETEEIPPSFAESMRILWQVRTLRRIWFSLPFLAAAVVGLISLTALYYEEVFGLDEAQRGFVAAAAEPAALVGLTIGIPLATRLMLRDPGLGLKMLAGVGVVVAAAWTVFALAPVLWLAILMNVVISGVVAVLAPGIFASLALAIPPKVRALGFSMASVWILPGLVFLPIVGRISEAWGIRQGLLVMVPVFLVGAAILTTASQFVKSDINRVWTSTAAQAEVLYHRRRGEAKLLLVRGVDVSYDGVQVLFGVDLEIDEGEIVALLGTNGAGKSTLLRAISGLVDADHGAIVFDGRDMTYAPPNEVAARGVVQVPGGQGVFPSLTVAENLRLASWLDRHHPDRAHAARERVLELFPILRDRLDDPAALLSGGQQQMLTLGMAFLTRPRLLMIDELSLGLAPAVVAQLLDLVRELKAQGTTIVLVEQSVNVAVTVAETAYFMEKGEVRFHGPTAELLDRPDVLRSVFLEGAHTFTAANGDRPAPVPVPVPATAVRTAPANGDAAAPRLEVRAVSRRFGGIAALQDVSLAAAPGEVVGFLGPNGAGKTTLFDVVSGHLPADGGRIVLDGRDVTGLGADAPRLGVGRSFQDARLFPALTVAETIAVACERSVDVRDPVAAALRLPSVVDSEERVHERVEELIALLGLDAFRHKFVHELSTGSRRIVDLACVLAHRPSLLLLDEPSSGIAEREAEALGPLILRIRDLTGATVLVIEHDVPLLHAVADRFVALDLGEVVADGPPDVVVHDPRVVTSYLGGSTDAVLRSGARDR